MYVDQPSPGKNRIIGFPPILMKVIYHSRGFFLITLIKLIKLLPKKDENDIKLTMNTEYYS